MRASPIIVRDEDVEALLPMSVAIEQVERMLAARAEGRCVTPPRHHVAFPGLGDLVFTVGGVTDGMGPLGFRVYDLFPGSRDQFTAIWEDGLSGIVLGSRLGLRRTGAIGGTAIKHLARADAKTLAVIGTGPQAHAQIEAALAVRPIDSIRVYSRDGVRRTDFARAVESAHSIATIPAVSARGAVTDADIVITATTSTTPVLDAAWLKPGVHINMLGPKARDAYELDPALADVMWRIGTDSIDQIRQMTFFLEGIPANRRVSDLTRLIDELKDKGRPSESSTLFVSVGLAGTEVALGAAVLAAAKSAGRNPPY